MTHYALTINGDEVVKIESDVPPWLPVPQRINRNWLRNMIAEALRKYYRRRLVVRA